MNLSEDELQQLQRKLEESLGDLLDKPIDKPTLIRRVQESLQQDFIQRVAAGTPEISRCDYNPDTEEITVEVSVPWRFLPPEVKITILNDLR